MIRSFRGKVAEQLFLGEVPRHLPPDIVRRSVMKLQLLDAAASLDFLRAAPGNRLEALRHDRQGQLSIRINDQWRICFVWRGGSVWDVEIVDYH